MEPMAVLAAILLCCLLALVISIQLALAMITYFGASGTMSVEAGPGLVAGNPFISLAPIGPGGRVLGATASDEPHLPVALAVDESVLAFGPLQATLGAAVLAPSTMLGNGNTHADAGGPVTLQPNQLGMSSDGVTATLSLAKVLAGTVMANSGLAPRVPAPVLLERGELLVGPTPAALPTPADGAIAFLTVNDSGTAPVWHDAPYYLPYRPVGINVLYLNAFSTGTDANLVQWASQTFRQTDATNGWVSLTVMWRFTVVNAGNTEGGLMPRLDGLPYAPAGWNMSEPGGSGSTAQARSVLYTAPSDPTTGTELPMRTTLENSSDVAFVILPSAAWPVGAVIVGMGTAIVPVVKI